MRMFPLLNILSGVYKRRINLFMDKIALAPNQAPIQKGLHPFLLGETEFQVPQPKTIPFLSNIPEKALADLMGKAKVVRYIKKEVFASDGDKADALFIIFSGMAWAFISNEKEGREVRFQVQESSSCYGEIALLTDELRSVSVITLVRTVFAVISKQDFKLWLMNCPDAKFAFL